MADATSIKVHDAVCEEQLPEPTPTPRDHEPEAAGGHDEDDEVEAHDCQPGEWNQQRTLMSEDAHTVHVEGLENGWGCAGDGASARLGRPFRVDLEEIKRRTSEPQSQIDMDRVGHTEVIPNVKRRSKERNRASFAFAKSKQHWVSVPVPMWIVSGTKRGA